MVLEDIVKRKTSMMLDYSLTLLKQEQIEIFFLGEGISAVIQCVQGVCKCCTDVDHL